MTTPQDGAGRAGEAPEGTPEQAPAVAADEAVPAPSAATASETAGGAPDAGASGGILAAVDGSDSADVALSWAVAEAQARGVPLTIAHAYHWPSSGLGAMEAIGFLMDALEQDSAEIVRAAGEAARAAAPDLQIHTVSRLGPPIPTVIQLARGKELVVVGSRGLGGFSGLLLGSVGTGLVTGAPCPVAVIRGERTAPADAPVLAGVDGTDVTDAVLEEAFAAARRRGCRLEVVHAWQHPTADVRTARGHGGGPLDAGDQVETWQRSVSDAVAECLGRARARYPDVPVEVVTSPGRAAAVLLERAASAQLLVVGTRGRGELAGMLLGSVSRAMVLHAPCPVLVVR